MKELSINEVSVVTGAGVLASEFSNAGLGFGGALDYIQNGGTNAQISSALGFGLGSVADGVISVGERLVNNAFNNKVDAIAKLGPSFAKSAGEAAGSVISSLGSAVGNAVGGVLPG